MASCSNIRTRNGLTLVELLTVLTIMAVLFAIAIPLVRPAFEDRTLREATRQVNAFFAGARARAAATGRPVGVWLERSVDPTGASFCNELFLAEASPPFIGATLESRAYVNDATGELTFSPGDAAVLRTLVHMNEVFRIQFDHKGHWYSGSRNAEAPEFRIDATVTPPGTEIGGRGLPYSITRAPTRSSVSPLALPGNAVIDLGVSGRGSKGQEFGVVANPETPVIIEFAPNGYVDYVFVDDLSWSPLSPIHLLIGRRSKVLSMDIDGYSGSADREAFAALFADPESSNLADPSNLWLTIGNRTGSVITAENADTTYVGPPGSVDPPDLLQWVTARIQIAREFARAQIRKGGR